MEWKRCLVTGGAGFIGSHLVEQLLLKSSEVIVVDDFSTGENEIPGAVYYQCDVRDRDIMSPIISQVDIVFHAAASVGVLRNNQHPLDSAKRTLSGGFNILELCSTYLKPLVLFSSSAAYGDQSFEKCPYNEDNYAHFGAGIGWCYGVEKMMLERLALCYQKERRSKILIVRPFNVVGPRQKCEYGMVIPTFIVAALLGKPLHVFNGGEQTRSFCWVKDAVEMVIDLADNSEYGQIFNVGNPKNCISMVDLAKKIQELTKTSSRIIVHPMARDKGGDVISRVPDIDKTMEVLKIESSYYSLTKLDEFLPKIIDYFKEEINENAIHYISAMASHG